MANCAWNNFFPRFMFVQVEPKRSLTSQLRLSNTGFCLSLCGCMRPASAPAVRCKASLNVKAFRCLWESTVCASHWKEACCRGERRRLVAWGQQRRRQTKGAEEDRKHDREIKTRETRWKKGEQQRPIRRHTQCVIDWVVYRCQGHTYGNCSFVVAARVAVRQSLSIVLPGHWDTVRLNGPKVTCRKSNSCHVHPQCWLTESGFLPRLLQQGPCLLVTDLAFRDSVVGQTSFWCFCGAFFSSENYDGFFFSFLLSFFVS